ncbi:MAG: hypothetical protein AB8G77_09890 [Rhodothermales bacterium]
MCFGDMFVPAASQTLVLAPFRHAAVGEVVTVPAAEKEFVVGLVEFGRGAERINRQNFFH